MQSVRSASGASNPASTAPSTLAKKPKRRKESGGGTGFVDVVRDMYESRTKEADNKFDFLKAQLDLQREEAASQLQLQIKSLEMQQKQLDVQLQKMELDKEVEKRKAEEAATAKILAEIELMKLKASLVTRNDQGM